MVFFNPFDARNMSTMVLFLFMAHVMADLVMVHFMAYIMAYLSFYMLQ